MDDFGMTRGGVGAKRERSRYGGVTECFAEYHGAKHDMRRVGKYVVSGVVDGKFHDLIPDHRRRVGDDDMFN